ncbi:hypothetical protein ACS0VU_14880 [Aliiroseovarius sp. KMU-71]|uniref:hypothetical protein n=1 Tax=Aliiroseovarius sp. KMU-71 TaxID=3453123 RepID=UPI003F452C75
MTKQAAWMIDMERWFDCRPQREYRLTKIPVDALQSASASGWVAGCASSPSQPNAPCAPLITPGDRSILCIVRRADAVEGRPVPGVFLMDGGFPGDPPTGNERAEEQFCDTIWGIFAQAQRAGVSFVAHFTSGVLGAPV